MESGFILYLMAKLDPVSFIVHSNQYIVFGGAHERIVIQVGCMRIENGMSLLA